MKLAGAVRASYGRGDLLGVLSEAGQFAASLDVPPSSRNVFADVDRAPLASSRFRRTAVGVGAFRSMTSAVPQLASHPPAPD